VQAQETGEQLRQGLLESEQREQAQRTTITTLERRLVSANGDRAELEREMVINDLLDHWDRQHEVYHFILRHDSFDFARCQHVGALVGRGDIGKPGSWFSSINWAVCSPAAPITSAAHRR
jgi:hypothetical protein